MVSSKKTGAVLGLRVKSGWATAVLVVRPGPRAVERRVVALSDDGIPGCTQPYHAVMKAPKGDAAAVEKRLCDAVRATTRKSVGELVNDFRQAGHSVRAIALVVGSTIDPARIGNEHIRAHALEGQLFRTALEDAAKSMGLTSTVVMEREVYAQAASALLRTEEELKRAVAELGRSLDGPWRADEKTATLAAWIMLEVQKH
jgi:hypothetical protein